MVEPSGLHKNSNATAENPYIYTITTHPTSHFQPTTITLEYSSSSRQQLRLGRRHEVICFLPRQPSYERVTCTDVHYRL